MILKAKFRFNRPIDKTKEFIHIDGFTVTADGKQYRFDFQTYLGQLNEDLSIVECEGKFLDTVVYPEFKDLPIVLKKIETLDECRIYIVHLEGDIVDDLYLDEILEFTLIEDGRHRQDIHDSTEYVNIQAEKHRYIKNRYRVFYSLNTNVLADYTCSHRMSLTEVLQSNAPEGYVIDGDTILKDQIDELSDQDYTGIFKDIVGTWKEAKTVRERQLLAKMFETFTGISMKEYLKKCIKNITKENK